jgi:hypothetical protein
MPAISAQHLAKSVERTIRVLMKFVEVRPNRYLNTGSIRYVTFVVKEDPSAPAISRSRAPWTAEVIYVDGTTESFVDDESAARLRSAVISER